MKFEIPFVVKVYAKTIAVFIAGIVVNMVTDLIQGSKPWPQTGDEWLQYLLSSFAVALAALLTRNKIIQKQLDKDPNVVGGFVVDDPANKAVVEHKPVTPVRPDTHDGITPWD
jgi:hypothetical protein